MKLSEAIRLGEFALPATHGCMWFSFDGENEKPCGACAVGRLVYAVGYRPEQFVDNFTAMNTFAERLWPWIKGAGRSAPPQTTAHRWITEFEGRDKLLLRISDLYENDGWSMGQIADYIATIEPVAPAHQVTTEVEVAVCQ